MSDSPDPRPSIVHRFGCLFFPFVFLCLCFYWMFGSIGDLYDLLFGGK